MNILFISLLDPSESGSGNQKVTLLSAKYLSSVGIHCFIAVSYTHLTLPTKLEV